MKNKPTKLFALAIAGLALASSNASAAHIFLNLLNEDFEDPDRGTGTRIVDTPTASQMTYAGWDFQGATNVFNMRESGSAGAEGAAGNQQVQFEWTGINAAYATTREWASTDEYSLSFNATEQSWNSVRDRFIVVEVVETVGELTLWSGIVELPEWDGIAAGGAWTAAQTFNFSFTGNDFVAAGGTEGSLITFEIGQLNDAAANALDPGNIDSLRGSFVDNISFTANVAPEPTSTILIGLGGLALILRRRK